MNNEQRGIVKPTANQMTHMSIKPLLLGSNYIPSIDLQLAGLQSRSGAQFTPGRSIQTHSNPFTVHLD